MARTFTLGDLVTRAKRRVDMENESLVSDTEWKNNISTVYGEMHSILVNSGMRYFESEDTITAGGGTSTGSLYEDYSLPSDFNLSVAMDYVVNSTTQERWNVPMVMSQERNRFGTGGTNNAIGYAIVGGNVRLLPAPPSGQTYIHTYIPQPTDYSASADGTSVDVVTPEGEEFLLWGVAVIALIKEESDPRDAERRQEMARERLEYWASIRAAEQPRRTQVSFPHFSDYGGYY